MLTRLKARLPEIMDASQDTLLNELLTGAQDWVLAWTGRDSLPDGCETAVVQFAVIAYHRMGMEGERHHSEGGITADITSIPEEIKALLRPWRIAKAGA